MARRPMIAGNWKMNKTPVEGTALVGEILAALPAGVAAAGPEIVVCPPFTTLAAVAAKAAGSPVAVGAQNVHWAANGAFTGEISAAMLAAVPVSHVIIGHSERRQFFGETDASVNQRTRAAVAAGLTAIVCVGETLAEREANRTTDVVGQQTRAGLAGLSAADMARVVIAYEPVWAIGTGLTASPAQAQEVHAQIRALLTGLGGSDAARKVAIQYGGSMKPDNARDLLAQPDIDGGLIGGAALKADSFLAIINAA